MVPYESITSLMRRSFLLGLDTFLLYYVFSRTPLDAGSFGKCLSASYSAQFCWRPWRSFEFLRGWLLYLNLGYQWEHRTSSDTSFANGRLRAQVFDRARALPGVPHGLRYGHNGLYLRHHILKRWWSHAVLLVLIAGLLASLSRGPMVSAVVMVFVLMAMGPKGGATVAKFATAFAVVLGLLLVSPAGDKVYRLPALRRSIKRGERDYRAQLLDTALMLIRRTCCLAIPFVLSQMEHLRQGQGIIDLVNGYILVALYFGVVGLSLFVGLMVVAIVIATRAWWVARSVDLDLSLIGASLLACMLGTLLYIFTTGFYPIHYVLIGLMLSYPGLKAVSVVSNSTASTQEPVAVHRPYAMPPMPERQAGGGRASARRPT